MTTLIAIPALGCDGRLYDAIEPRLPASVTMTVVIAGKDRFSDCVAQVLEAAPEQFVVLGTSFGGRTAMELAVAAPDRVRGLVVTGSSPGPSPDVEASLKRSARSLAGEFEQVISELGAIISHLPGPNGPAARDTFIAMARQHGAELVARQSEALAYRGDLRPRLAAIACPALMLWGSHDQLVGARDGRALAMAIPGARYVEIPQCGHLPTLEAPDETADAIAHWLADNQLI